MHFNAVSKQHFPIDSLQTVVSSRQTSNSESVATLTVEIKNSPSKLDGQVSDFADSIFGFGYKYSSYRS